MITHVLPAFADRVLPVDTAVALRCARLHVPNPGAERDMLIASTALVHGLTMVTRMMRARRRRHCTFQSADARDGQSASSAMYC